MILARVRLSLLVRLSITRNTLLLTLQMRHFESGQVRGRDGSVSCNQPYQVHTGDKFNTTLWR